MPRRSAADSATFAAALSASQLKYEKKLSALALKCPTVELVSTTPDGRPILEYFSESKFANRLPIRSELGREHRDFGGQLALETIDILASRVLRDYRSGYHDDKGEDPEIKEENIEWEADWLAWKLTIVDGPYDILRAILHAVFERDYEFGSVEHGFIDQFLGAIIGGAVYKKTKAPPRPRQCVSGVAGTPLRRRHPRAS